MQPSDPEPVSFLLTEQDVADYFTVSLHTVRSWRYRGLLPYVKVGNHVRIESEELIRFVNQRRHSNTIPEGAISA